MAEIQVGQAAGMRVQLLREGRQWTITDAAQRAGVSAATWEAFEEGRTIPADAYRTILQTFGFTEHSMAFIDRVVRQGAVQ